LWKRGRVRKGKETGKEETGEKNLRYADRPIEARKKEKGEFGSKKRPVVRPMGYHREDRPGDENNLEK